MIDGPSGESILTFDRLLNPTLEAIRSLGGSASIAEINNLVIETLDLTTAIAQIPHGLGRMTELEYRLGWSRTYLKKIWPDRQLRKRGLVIYSVRIEYSNG